MEGQSITYGEMYEKAKQIATGLIACGHKPGDRIGILGPNQHQWMIAMWAIAMSGMQMVTINPMFTAPELEYAINKVDITGLICPQEIGPLNYRATLNNMIPDLEKSEAGNLNFSNVPTLKSITMFNLQEEVKGVFDFDSLFNAGGSKELEVLNSVKIDPMSPVNVQFTSGTTGQPKAAALTHHAILNNARGIAHMGNSWSEKTNTTYLTHTDSIWCNNLPLYHVFSFTAGAILATITKGLSFSNHMKIFKNYFHSNEYFPGTRVQCYGRS